MRNINEAFEEFISRRCEDIVLKDEYYQKLNKSIVDSEKKLKLFLNEEQLKTFIEYEKLVANFESYAETLLYKKGFNDAMHMNSCNKNKNDY
jgi:hypothetical protein